MRLLVIPGTRELDHTREAICCVCGAIAAGPPDEAPDNGSRRTLEGNETNDHGGNAHEHLGV